jgi:hypothetical protein
MPNSEKKPSWSSLNRKMAKAETVLVLALATDALLNPWLFAQPQIPSWGKTALKMLIIVGSFGPVFKIISSVIDESLDATRNVTSNWFSFPKVATHLGIMAMLFLGFYWTMHHSTPWQDFSSTRTAAKNVQAARMSTEVRVDQAPNPDDE